MKNSATLVSVFCCLLFCFNGTAQSNTKKPTAFNSFPKIVYCPASAVANLFSVEEGKSAKLQFDENHLLEGTIIKKYSKYSNTLQTVVMQIPAYGNSIFSISKRKDTDNSDVFIGHLYNTNFADGFELQPAKNNQYQLVKLNTNQVLQPCNQ